MNPQKSLKILVPDNELLYERFLEFSTFLSTGLGVSAEIELCKVIAGVPFPNGTWSGIIGQMRRGEADLTSVPMVITEERAKAVDFSYPFHINTVTFVTRKLIKNPEIWTIFYPFSFQVWMALLATFITMTLIFYALLKKKKNYLDILMNIFSCLLSQSASLRSLRCENNSEKLMLLAWILGATFLTHSYLSLLLSFLTFPPISTIEDIPQLASEVKAGRYKTMARDTSPYPGMLRFSEEENGKIIGESIFQNPEGFASIEKFINSQERNLAFIEMSQYLSFLNDEFLVSDDFFFLVIAGVPLKRNFCCKKKLDMVIHRIAASGLFEKVLEDIQFKKSLTLNNSNYDILRPLTLFDVSGAFIILISGLFLSFILLVAEICSCNKNTSLFKKHKSRRKRNSNAIRKFT